MNKQYPAILFDVKGASIGLGRYATDINQFGDICFGTQYSLTEELLDMRTVWEGLGIRHLSYSNGDISQSIPPPSGWGKTFLDSKFCSGGAYVTFAFRFSHDQRMERALYQGHYPRQLFSLMSGYLQTGEEPSFQNFRRYRTGRGIRFQLFALCQFGCRVYLFHPTLQRIADTNGFFEDAGEILEIFRSIRINVLLGALRSMYALVLLTEAQLRQSSDSLSGLIADESRRLEEIFGEYRGRMGPVYNRQLSGKKLALPIRSKYLKNY